MLLIWLYVYMTVHGRFSVSAILKLVRYSFLSVCSSIIMSTIIWVIFWLLIVKCLRYALTFVVCMFCMSPAVMWLESSGFLE